MSTTKRPNILLITSDQHHWMTMGMYNKEVKTPNLDRLAARGMRFDRAYCPNPTCTPTRASIITGQYPSQHGAWSLGTKLPESAHTVGEDFQAAGYRTALVGKAHFQQLDSTDEYPSLESYPIMQDLDFWRAFDEPFYGFQDVELLRNHVDESHVGQHYAIWMEEKGFSNWRDHFWDSRTPTRQQQYKWTLPEEFHYNAFIAERTNQLMDRYTEDDTPFFLWASFPDPHPPYLVSEPWDTMYDPDALTLPTWMEDEHEQNPPHFKITQEENPDTSYWLDEPEAMGAHGVHSHVWGRHSQAKDVAVYYGMVSMMDKYIGKILDHLEEKGLADNTLVVFTTDHGHFFGQHGLFAKGPYHYEDMIKIPFIATMPGTIPENTTTDALVSLVDLAPTFLSLAGQRAPRSMTGVDQTATLKDPQAAVRDHIIVEHHHQPTRIHVKTYVNDRYKLTVYMDQTYGELFDLQEDPQELSNLWDSPEHKDLKNELTLKLLHGEMKKEPMWMPRVAHA